MPENMGDSEEPPVCEEDFEQDVNAKPCPKSKKPPRPMRPKIRASPRPFSRIRIIDKGAKSNPQKETPPREANGIPRMES